MKCHHGTAVVHATKTRTGAHNPPNTHHTRASATGAVPQLHNAKLHELAREKPGAKMRYKYTWLQPRTARWQPLHAVLMHSTRARTRSLALVPLVG